MTIIDSLYGYVKVTLSKSNILKEIKVVIALGIHLFPFRTEKLSPTTSMVLRKSGRVDSKPFCRHFAKQNKRNKADNAHNSNNYKEKIAARVVAR